MSGPGDHPSIASQILANMAVRQADGSDITPREAFWVNVMRIIAGEKKKEIRKKWHVGRLVVGFTWRSRKNLMGRFGGGWNWVVGFEAGGRTIIFNLLICSISIRLEKRKATNPKD